MLSISEYKKENSLNTRQIKTFEILKKYPTRIPIFVDTNKNQDFTIEKQKYLVPEDLSIAQFMYILRNKINLDKSQSIYLFIKDKNGKMKLPQTIQSLRQIYNEFKDDDSCLYMTIYQENVFG